jgi:hypothetical protein
MPRQATTTMPWKKTAANQLRIGTSQSKIRCFDKHGQRLNSAGNQEHDDNN